MANDKHDKPIRIEIGPVKVPTTQEQKAYDDAQAVVRANAKHGVDTVTIHDRVSSGGTPNTDYTDNHGNRLNEEHRGVYTANPYNAQFAFCVSGKQLSEAEVKAAMAKVKSGKRTDYAILDMFASDQTYEFKGPNPIENACKPDKPKGR